MTKRPPPDPRVQTVAQLMALAVVRWHQRKRRPTPGPETRPCTAETLPPLSDAKETLAS